MCSGSLSDRPVTCVRPSGLPSSPCPPRVALTGSRASIPPGPEGNRCSAAPTVAPHEPRGQAGSMRGSGRASAAALPADARLEAHDDGFGRDDGPVEHGEGDHRIETG